jgi:hypothetical protein
LIERFYIKTEEGAKGQKGKVEERQRERERARERM